MFKRFSVIPLSILLLAILIGPAICQIDQKAKDDLYQQVELFSYALTTVQSEYAEEPAAKDLIYGSLKGMLASLDPHSQFLSPDDYKELKTETEGKFGGLGIEISVRDGLLTVITPLEDTPAWKVGLKPGDKIVKIEDELTRDMTLDDAVKKLRGKPGTDVNITILRESEFKIHEFKITREIIHVQDVKDPMILEDTIGYVRLAEFREDSAKDFHKALMQIKDQGADSLILDLRNNPGGLLNVAIDITQEFLPEGMVVVSTKGRHPSLNTETKSTNKSTDFTTLPIVVLINEGSASGSEILAGALKDNKRAIILGEKSFGKGSVQSVVPLPDGSALRLTTSKYFTPSGVSIHNVGIIPDIVVAKIFKDETEGSPEKSLKENVDKIFNNIEENGAQEKSKEPEGATVQEGDKPAETKEAKEVKEPEAKKKLLEDNQVQSAISVLKGIKVYTKLKNP
ncbi:MAG: S41 family peptidase [Candidatus Omnitrophota bacterium]